MRVNGMEWDMNIQSAACEGDGGVEGDKERSKRVRAMRSKCCTHMQT